jgi:hypothetical protein
MIETAIDSTVPLIALLLLGYITYNAYKYIMTLSVVGKPNEWVVLISDGKLKTAGIGLSCFRGPMD